LAVLADLILGEVNRFPTKMAPVALMALLDWRSPRRCLGPRRALAGK